MRLELIIAIISAIITVIFGLIAYVQGRQNKKLRDNNQQVYIRAKTVVQHNYFNNAPREIKENLEFITSHTASAIAIIHEKIKKKVNGQEANK